MEQTSKPKPTLGAYIVGAYLFSVPSFGYSESVLLVVPQITGAILMAYAILDGLGSLKLRIPREIQLYGFMGLWAGITFSFGASTSEWNSLGTLIKVVVATLACAQLIKNESDLFTALKIYAFSVLFVYYQNMGDLKYLRVADKVAETDRFAGTLTNANTAAMFSLAVIWACLLLLLKSRSKSLERALYLVPIGISLLIIYYSGSKKGLLGIGLFAVFLTRLMYLRQTSFYRKIAILLASSGVVVVSGYFIYTSPFFFRLERLLFWTSGSDIKRWDLAVEAIHVWLRNGKTFIMGVGHDNFRLFSSLQAYAHSTPLELLASLGLVGFCLFMGFLSLLVLKFVYLYRRASDRESKSTFFAILIFLFMFCFFMMAAVLHDSKELLPIMGALAAYGQIRLGLIERNPEAVLQALSTQTPRIT